LAFGCAKTFFLVLDKSYDHSTKEQQDRLLEASLRRITWQQRLRYSFDNSMSRGPIALIGWLFLASSFVIFTVAFVVWVTGIGVQIDEKGDKSYFGFWQLTWMALMRTIDSGTVTGDSGTPAYLVAMLVVTAAGIFLVSSLIGIITSGLDARLTELRKGKSVVIEQDHTLILGWSPQIFPIISELALANANRSKACIVVLADQDKVEMEDEIRARVGKLGRTQVVCRSGSPIDLTALEMGNPHQARSVIVLAPAVDDPDSEVIKTVLALTNNPNRRKDAFHIVAVIRDERNLEAAKLVGKDEAHFVLAGDLISRITVQTCRQSGLSVVYTELLDFGGDEIYIQAVPELTGKTFGEGLFAFEDSSLMGLVNRAGEVLINPPMSTRIEAGDQLIVISEDDDTIKLSGLKPRVDLNAILAPRALEVAAEHTLILGWNRQAITILQELDQYVAPGSSVTIVADLEMPDELLRERGSIKRQTLLFESGDTTDRRTLEALEVIKFDHVIVLAYSDTLGVQQADAKTLITLLHLREMSYRAGRDLSIVSEMLDNGNRELAEVTNADDFIVSDKLISLMLSQVSENKKLAQVFRLLFSSDGSELYLRPASSYVKPGVGINFYTVLEAARQRNEVAIGYRIQADARDASKAYGVKVNPKKSDRLNFAPEDQVLVLAEG
jgi:ion channel POLLUX/CASTOR